MGAARDLGRERGARTEYPHSGLRPRTKRLSCGSSPPYVLKNSRLVLASGLVPTLTQKEDWRNILVISEEGVAFSVMKLKG